MSDPRTSEKKTALHIVSNKQGTFDLYLNDYLDRHDVSGDWLEEEICVRFGYCGEEFKLMWRDLEADGQVTRTF